MSEPTARENRDGRALHARTWFWTWTLGVLALVLVPAFLLLRWLGEIASARAYGALLENLYPPSPPPTVARLLWSDVKLLPNAIAWLGLAGLVFGAIVGLLQAAGVRGHAPLRAWVGRAALAWVTGSVFGFLVVRSCVIAVFPQVLLDTRWLEWCEPTLAPFPWAPVAGVLVAMIAQLRHLTARPIRMSRLLIWPMTAVLILHVGAVAVVAGARHAELGELWREQSVDALTVRLQRQTDRRGMLRNYDDACREGMPAACATCASSDCAQMDAPQIVGTYVDPQQRVINLDLLACAGGSGAGCAALAEIYRRDHSIVHGDTWAALFDRHACLLGAASACKRVTGAP